MIKETIKSHTGLLRGFCAIVISAAIALTVPLADVRADGIAEINNAKMTSVVVPTETSLVYNFTTPVMSSLQHTDTASWGNPNNPYGDLRVPTQLTRAGSYYFLVDCYHDQVLYSGAPGTKLREWKVMTNKVAHPHTVASDGSIYMVDDTDNNRIMVFEWLSGRFQNTQIINGINKPHYVTYDPPTGAFYVWSSETGSMYILKRQPGSNRVGIYEIRQVNELVGVYVRSFTISGEDIIFPSGGNSNVLVVDKNTFSVKGRIPVPGAIAGMAQIYPIDGWYYITVSTDINMNQSAATMIRTRDLGLLTTGVYESVYSRFNTTGTPYFISRVDGSYYLANHGSSKGIFRFNSVGGEISGITPVH